MHPREDAPGVLGRIGVPGVETFGIPYHGLIGSVRGRCEGWRRGLERRCCPSMVDEWLSRPSQSMISPRDVRVSAELEEPEPESDPCWRRVRRRAAPLTPLVRSAVERPQPSVS